MAFLYRERDYRAIAASLESETYCALLRRIQRDAATLPRWPAWRSVIESLQGAGAHDPLQEELLAVILRAFREDGNPYWRSVLLVLCWPILSAVFCRSRGWSDVFDWDDGEDELWGYLLAVFCDLLETVPSETGDGRYPLAGRIYRDVLDGVRDEYRRRLTRRYREQQVEPEALEELSLEYQRFESVDCELRDAQEAMVRKLRAHCEAGRISEPDLLMLVGTRLYGKSLRGYADEAGIDYEVAKKRRQRAEAAIRRGEKRCPRNLARRPFTK